MLSETEAVQISDHHYWQRFTYILWLGHLICRAKLCQVDSLQTWSQWYNVHNTVVPWCFRYFRLLLVSWPLGVLFWQKIQVAKYKHCKFSKVPNFHNVTWNPTMDDCKVKAKLAFRLALVSSDRTTKPTQTKEKKQPMLLNVAWPFLSFS